MVVIIADSTSRQAQKRRKKCQEDIKMGSNDEFVKKYFRYRTHGDHREIFFPEGLLQNERFIFFVMPEVFYPASGLLLSGREVDSGSTPCRK